MDEYYFKFYMAVCLGKPGLNMSVYRINENDVMKRDCVFDKVYQLPLALLNYYHLLEVLPDKEQEVFVNE